MPTLYLVAALVGAALPSGRAAQAPDHRIALVAGPIHYDLLLPLDPETRARFGWLARSGIPLDHPDARWLVVGWGARAFYTTAGTYSDVQASAVWRGLTGDSSVMHVSLAGDLDGIRHQVLPLDREQYQALTSAIIDRFSEGAETRALPVPGFHDYDRFYPAKDRFDLFRTCNVWIGSVLRSADVRFGRWTPLPVSVRLSAWLWTPGFSRHAVVSPGPASLPRAVAD
ncbi:MAG: TIGR02117 family protein [Pseudooceanicola sp.]|nr:TIGR02117 family protein [Pseudooceanicola sp.]